MRADSSFSLLAASFALLALPALGAPVTYQIDSNHTYPSFETDHFGGLSTWRGKFNSSAGTIILDREAQSGTIQIEIDAASIDMGHERMNDHVKSDDMLDVAKFPTATYAGKLTKFENGSPTAVDGTLTLHGVTKPVALTIDRFKCMKHPMSGKEICGANAVGKFNREDFGISFGKDRGFNMDVTVQVQVEAVRAAAEEAT